METWPQPRIPISTYRLQFNHSFTFSDARQVIPYLHTLGISDCYASPYLKATPGSTHGYDVVDPTQLNPEVGSEADYHQMVEELHRFGMGQILDVVPNHMGIDKQINPWWLDVLENGPSSPYAGFFDIDWRPIKRELEDKVLLPILGDLYGKVLENQEIILVYENGSFFLRYYEHRLPVDPKPSAMVLSYRLGELVEQMGVDDPRLHELQSIITALQHLPSRRERDPELIQERRREKEVIKRRLAAVVNDSPILKQFIEGNVRLFNGTKGDPASFDLLDELVDDQAYRLAYWRVASEEINFRRFFDINELAAIRMEDPEVFRQSHALIFRLLKEGAVTGLRIDHVDGLNDPGIYLRHLQTWAQNELRPRASAMTDSRRPLYVVVEKILGTDEELPEGWPVFGTTGYDFLNILNGLFVDTASARAMDDIYTRFIHDRISLEDLAYDAKKLIMRSTMASEINALGHQLNRLSERDRWSRDFTLYSLTLAIREIIACFPVYRTYVTERTEVVLERDRAYIRRAVAKAKRKNPTLSGLVFDFVRDLLLNPAEEAERLVREEVLRFIMKFQQVTSPVTAKGIEDTAFYIYNRLVSLNEVGGEPDHFGLTLAAFHKHMRERQARWPHALSATSTHDTKRSEDVRARINVLSEMPKEWKARVSRWAKLNKKWKSDVEGRVAPTSNEEYLLYQTLIGAWPFGTLDDEQHGTFVGRIQGYMAKALKEAKVNTSWVNPDQAYEDAVQSFVDRVLGRSPANPFLEDFASFQHLVAEYGMYNALSQVLIKILAPGVPDFYQGTEGWDLSLVDPDNRRPVDYAGQAKTLEHLLKEAERTDAARLKFAQELLDSRQDGRIKFYVTMTGLRYRAAHVPLFQEGDYVPLEATGAKKDRLCSFARISGDLAVVAVAPRLVAGLMGDTLGPPVGKNVWEDTRIPVPSWRAGSRYRNILTGEELTTTSEEDRQMLLVGEILAHFPVALLERAI